MAAALPYVSSPGNVEKALNGIKTAATPTNVSQDFVKTTLKIAGGPGNEMTSYLKKIGFTGADGTPTEIYKAGADRLWVADITYVPTWAGFLFLAVVLDAWSRRIIGWAMASHLRTELVLAALDMAVAQRRPTDVIHHSDQGCQYTSVVFGQRCREAGIRPSMGSVGDAYDNAMCESFFATLECELLDRHRFRTQMEARLAIFDFIEGWYNPRRRHSALDYLSPMVYERAHAAGDRTVASGSTIAPGGAMSIPPRCRCSEEHRVPKAVPPPPNRGNSTWRVGADHPMIAA